MKVSEHKMFLSTGISGSCRWSRVSQCFMPPAGFECSAAAGSGVSRRTEAGCDLQRPRPSPWRLSAAQLGASWRPRPHRLLPGGAAEDSGTTQGGGHSHSACSLVGRLPGFWLSSKGGSQEALTECAFRIYDAKCFKIKESNIKKWDGNQKEQQTWQNGV